MKMEHCKTCGAKQIIFDDNICCEADEELNILKIVTMHQKVGEKVKLTGQIVEGNYHG